MTAWTNTRRGFIGAGLSAAAACLPGCRLPCRSEEYSGPLLGDVHYDRPPLDVFHYSFRRLHEADGMFERYKAEFESFSSMWGECGRSEALVKASGLCRLKDSAFALNMHETELISLTRFLTWIYF